MHSFSLTAWVGVGPCPPHDAMSSSKLWIISCPLLRSLYQDLSSRNYLPLPRLCLLQIQTSLLTEGLTSSLFTGDNELFVKGAHHPLSDSPFSECPEFSPSLIELITPRRPLF
jgi:hypothetical protein